MAGPTSPAETVSLSSSFAIRVGYKHAAPLPYTSAATSPSPDPALHQLRALGCLCTPPWQSHCIGAVRSHDASGGDYIYDDFCGVAAPQVGPLASNGRWQGKEGLPAPLSSQSDKSFHAWWETRPHFNGSLCGTNFRISIFMARTW
jgi:hypothetical protein